jgi:hypothetical protein
MHARPWYDFENFLELSPPNIGCEERVRGKGGNVSGSDLRIGVDPVISIHDPCLDWRMEFQGACGICCDIKIALNYPLQDPIRLKSFKAGNGPAPKERGGVLLSGIPIGRRNHATFLPRTVEGRVHVIWFFGNLPTGHRFFASDPPLRGRLRSGRSL